MTFDNSAFDRRVDRTGLVLLVLVTAGTFFFYSARAAASLAVGGLISTVNYRWLKQAVDFVILQGGVGPVGKRVAWQYAGRYALIVVTLYVTIHFSLLIPALIVAGLLVYVFAVLLESVVEIGKSWKNSNS
ncbi:MAG TPA: ATP synthase subunit I [Terriglobia bacterium]|nr:ATP synthase subunit I [Terriglobia bacterium]